MSVRKVIDQDILSSEQLGILKKASENIFFFAQMIFLVHPIRGKVNFKLYGYQMMTLYHFIKNRFNVILKFRQAGVTELISMFCLWYAMYHPNKTIVIISIKDRVAKKVLRKIKYMYKNLPPYVRTKIINGRTEQDFGTASEIEFANGSIISSIPTTEEAGRSEAVSLLVIDEAAIVRWANRIWSAAFPTLSTGGRAIINSTAYGVGNFFHKLWVDALAGGNPFTPIRLKWQMHPERDWDWYNLQKQILGPRKTAQEIDGDFLTSGNTVFDLWDIRDIEEHIAEEVNPVLTRMEGLLKVFRWAKPGERCVLGMDIATGRSNDYTAMSVMNQEGEELMAMKARISLDKAEKLAVKYSRKFNDAIVAPESNDIGLGLAVNLQNNGFTNLYYSKSLLRKKGKSKPEVQEIPGWYTTRKNRPVIIAELEDDIRNNTCEIKDKFFCDEAYTFIYDSRNRPVALNKDKESSSTDILDDEVYTDDAILCKAITNHVRKEIRSSIYVHPH